MTNWETLEDKEALDRRSAIKQFVLLDDPIAMTIDGATFSQRSFLSNSYLVGRYLALQRDERVCLALPLHHTLSFPLGILSSVIHGSVMVQGDINLNNHPNTTVDVMAILRSSIQLEQSNVIITSPSFLKDLLSFPKLATFNLSSLKRALIVNVPGDTNTSKELVSSAKEKLGLQQIFISFSTAETGIFLICDATDPSTPLTSVGKVIDNAEIKIVDEKGRTVNTNVFGKLMTRGHHAIQGRFKTTSMQVESISHDDWLSTSVQAMIDEHGFVFLK